MTKDAVLELLGSRPIAYHPALAKVCGGVTAAVFLSQLLYWTGKQRDPDGWIFKTQAEMQEETGLTRSNQETARRKLVELSVIEEKKAGIPAQLHYRVKLDILASLLVEMYHTSAQESDKLESAESTVHDAEPQQCIPETTIDHGIDYAENTHRRVGGFTTDDPASEYRERLKQALVGYAEKESAMPALSWGAHSRAIQRWQSTEVKHEHMLDVCHLLDTEFGRQPAWRERRTVRRWADEAAQLYLDAGGDLTLIRAAMRRFVSAGLTFKGPGSLRSTVVDLVAKQRTQPAEADLAAQMTNDPQYQAFVTLEQQRGASP